MRTVWLDRIIGWGVTIATIMIPIVFVADLLWGSAGP